MITGIGIRQFIDLYIIANSVELDWKWIKEQLEQIRLWKFCLMCMGFCKTTFGPLKENIPYKEVDESTYRDTIKKIFRDGVFGQYDEHNKKYAKAMMAKIYEKKDKKYVIRNIKKLFFPSYLEIGKYPRCQFVKKQRVLLPIGWLVRYYQIICSVIKKEKTISIVQSVNKNDSEFVKRIDYMQRWGL